MRFGVITSISFSLMGIFLMSSACSDTTQVPDSFSSPTPTFVPGPKLPVLAGTPVPIPNEPITPKNADQIRELAIWGKGRISQVAFSPNGEILAVGTAAGIWLYDAETSELLRFIETESWVNELTFGPNSKTIMSTLGGLIFAEWDINTGQQIERRTFDTPEKSFIDGALSADGTIFAIPSFEGGYVNVWETKNGNLLAVLPTEDTFGYADTMALSSDGGLLVVKSKDVVQVWDVQTSKRLFTFRARKQADYNYFPFFFSLDGKWLFVRDELWNIQDQHLYCELGDSINFVVSFSPDGQSIVTGNNGTINVWNIETCEHQYTLNEPDGQIIDLAHSSDGKYLVSGSRNATVQVWNAEKGTVVSTLEGYWPHIPNLAVSPEGTIIFSPGFDEESGPPWEFEREIQIWDIETGQVIETLSGHQTDVTVHLTIDGKIMVSHSHWDSLQVWDMKNREVIRSSGGTSGHIVLSPEGSKTAFLAYDGRRTAADIIDTQTGEDLYRVGCGGRGTNVDFSPDGTKLVTTEDNLCLWDAETGELLFAIKDMPFEFFGQPTWSPDGKMVAVGADGNTILMWNMDTRQFIHRLPADSISLLAFSSDGKILAVGNNNGRYLGEAGVLPLSIRLWEVDTGTLLHTIEDYHGSITHLSFSPGGKFLATSAADGTVRLWGVPTE